MVGACQSYLDIQQKEEREAAAGAVDPKAKKGAPAAAKKEDPKAAAGKPVKKTAQQIEEEEAEGHDVDQHVLLHGGEVFLLVVHQEAHVDDVTEKILKVLDLSQ